MSLLEQHESRKLRDLARSVRQYTQGADGSTPLPTAIKGLRFLRSDQAGRPGHCLFKPALYMTLQGSKWATFGEKRYKFVAGQGLMVAVDIPSRGTVIDASSRKPYLGLEIERDFTIMQQVAEEIGMALTASGKSKARGAFVLELNRQLVDCAQHAIRLLDTHGIHPHDALTFAVVPPFLAAIALAAGWIPARRAASIEPMVALRAE